MNAPLQLIANGQGSQAVSARELYLFLDYDSSQWARWSRKNIVKNQFAREGVDWEVFDTMSKTSEGGRPATDYVLTVDFGERLCMLARTEKGEEVRRWFQSLKQLPAQLSRKELAMMVIQIEEEKEALQRQLDVAQPKVEYVDTVLNTDDCVVTTVIATELGYSAVTFNKLLRDQGIQWKVDGVWVLTSKYAGKGYTQMRTHTYNDQYGKLHTTMAMVWTQRGRAMLHYLFKQKTEVAVVVR